MSTPGRLGDVAAGALLADRYRLEDVLGHGGMAVVHRGVDELLHRPVAVKVLHDRAADERERDRFSAEARTLAGLSHSGLVTVLDAGLAGPHAEQPFLVMELVPGQTLADRLRQGPLDLERAGSIGVQLAEAVAYAHEQGIVHRDLKPANVLLDDDAQRVKLADFGIARLVSDEAAARHTRTGTMIGTAAYLSPEQVQGLDAGPASDVYALGLVLLEALTGHREYPGTPTEAAFARLHRAPLVPDHLPETWRDVLATMTAEEPRARPSAAVVARRLRGEPMTGPIPIPLVDRSAGATSVMPAGPTGVVAKPFTDRAGDALVHRLHDLVRWARGLDASERGVAGAVVALLLFLLVVGLAA